MPNNNLFVLTPCLLHLCFLHNIFSGVFVFFLRTAEIGRNSTENSSLLSHEGTYLHLRMRCSAQSHLYLIQRNFFQVLICQFCRRFNSEKSEEVSFMTAWGWNAEVGNCWCWWCSAWPWVLLLAINEEASLLWSQESSYFIKPRKKACFAVVRPFTAL